MKTTHTKPRTTRSATVDACGRAPVHPTRHPVPLFSSQPAAGFPAPGDDLVEQTLDLNELLVTDAAATFFVRVRGNSMEGAGIFDGDVLVVNRAAEATAGTIVVAAVYGELVVKKLAQEQGRYVLVSAAPGYAPIAVEENDECFVWGVVTGSVRQFRTRV